jgi:hypothetical protein
MRYIFENIEEKEMEQVAEVPDNVKALTKTSTVIFAGVAFLSLMIPFGFGHPQWLIGAIVNAILFSAVLFLPKKYWLPLIIFPSLGVLARGLIFGPLTFFLIYFLPFVWLGNFALVLVFEKSLNYFKINTTNKNYSHILENKRIPDIKYLFAVLLAGVAKFAFLFLTANLYFNLKVVPKIFVTSMGLNQLQTALAGGVISILIFKAFKNYKIRNI